MTKTDTPGVIAPPPLIYLGFLLAGWGIEMLLRDVTFGLDGNLRRYGGVALLVIGFVIEGEATTRFRRSGTAVEPWKASTKLVTGGLYRFSRNPIYVGMAVLYCGLALLLDSPLALGLLIPCLFVIDRGVIAREEPYLEARFGQEYRDYRTRVRRWL